MRQPRTWPKSLKIRQFDCDDERAIDRTVTVELPRDVADNMVGITANVGSGDLTVAGIACHDLNLTLDSGDVEFTGTVTDTLNAEVGSGDVTFELYQAPAKSMDGETVLNLEFDNGDKSATYRFEVGSGDMSFDSE